MNCWTQLFKMYTPFSPLDVVDLGTIQVCVLFFLIDLTLGMQPSAISHPPCMGSTLRSRENRRKETANVHVWWRLSLLMECILGGWGGIKVSTQREMTRFRGCTLTYIQVLFNRREGWRNYNRKPKITMVASDPSKRKTHSYLRNMIQNDFILFFSFH